jgi:Winged helix DNA-binding domain
MPGRATFTKSAATPVPPQASLKWKQVTAWRLRRHHLDQRAPRNDMLRVAADVCGLHAQVTSSAEMTLWARVDGVKRPDVRTALWDERTLVKTWAMRGTLHMFPTRSFPAWLAAQRTRLPYYRRQSWLRYFGFTKATELDRLIGAIGSVLEGKELTREELIAAVGKKTRSKALAETLRGSWGSALKPAAFTGNLCFAPSTGQNVRFTNPHTWLGGIEELDPDAGAAESTRAFLAANGPATRDDFARWWGTTPSDALRMIRSVGDDAVAVDVEGDYAWALAAGVTEIESARVAKTVRLVPAFDQYVVGVTKHAERLMPGPHRDLVYRAQGWLSSVLLVDGRMLGTWRHDRKGRRLAVTFHPFVKIPARVRSAAEAEAELLAAFLGGSVEIDWVTPPA